MPQHTTPDEETGPRDSQTDDTAVSEALVRWRRRGLIQAVGSASLGGLAASLTSKPVRAEHETNPCSITIDFKRAHLVRVVDVAAANLTSLTVFYFDRRRTAHKQEDIDPTVDAEYGDAPLRVRYDSTDDQTIIQIGGRRAAVRRIVAFGPDCRSAKTNPLDSAAGENEAPTADFTWSPDPAFQPLTFTSTATDPDGELIHHGWDFDGDGTEDAAGEQVKKTFSTLGDHDVTHTVIDDFDATDSVTKTLDVQRILVETSADLQAIADPDDELYPLDGDYLLANDLDLSGIDDYNPIGTSETPFTGSFKGGSTTSRKTIRNVTIKPSSKGSKTAIGLFGVVEGATIENLVLENVSVEGGFTDQGGCLVGENVGGTVVFSRASGQVSADTAGGLVGINDGGEIRRSNANATIDGIRRAGGLVGTNFNGGSIRTSATNGKVTGSGAVGGLVGDNDNAEVRESASNATVDGSQGVGGLVGKNVAATVIDSAASGSVDGGQEVGGLVGYAKDGVIRDSAASGAVDGGSSVGGLVGENDGGEIRASPASGDVVGGGSSGGLVGDNVDGSVIDSPASGTVDGSSWVGGLVGHNDSGTVKQSSASGVVTGTNTLGGLVGMNDGGDIRDSNADGAVDGTAGLGGLVGDNDAGTVVDSTANGDVSGTTGTFTGGTVGGLVGTNSGDIRRSAANGDVEGSTEVGGTVGINLEDGVIETSDAAGDVTASSFAGGFAGTNKGTIAESTAAGTVAVSSGLDPGAAVGGFAGENSGTVRLAAARGTVDGIHVEGGSFLEPPKQGTNEAGGFVGRNTTDGTVERSAAGGDVTASDRTGGFVGRNRGEVSESTADGTVTGRKAVGGHCGINDGGMVRASSARGEVGGEKNIGGLVGDNAGGTVDETFSSGDVGTTSVDFSTVGGLIGTNTGTVTASYWDVPASGNDDSAGGVGLGHLADTPPADEMTGKNAPTNMSGFDFTNTWKTVTNPADYPALRSLTDL